MGSGGAQRATAIRSKDSSPGTVIPVKDTCMVAMDDDGRRIVQCQNGDQAPNRNTILVDNFSSQNQALD